MFFDKRNRFWIVISVILISACTRHVAEEGQGTPTGEGDKVIVEEKQAVFKQADQELAAGDMTKAKPAPAAQRTLSSLAPSFVRPALTEPVDRENYHHLPENRVLLASEQPVSTFSIDVDTGSYSNARRMLNQGRLPVQDAVRIEEFINYFDYDYPAPRSKETPFSLYTEIGPSPWNPKNHLLHIGIQGYDVEPEQRPAANLVFLVDVSGSMSSDRKLGLLKRSLILLSQQMTERDQVSLVVYAGASGVVLEPVAGNQTARINSALQQLQAGGSTNGASGIQLAYQMARQAFIPNGINRILLATDGDFNVGTVNFEQLVDLVERERQSGIGLSTLGFGTGNYNDHLMEQLADSGNGQYAYIDTINEARKVLVDQLSGTLQTIAQDVKIQIEFNPKLVKEYRLIGYENRMLNREDFNNDKVDAGDIGAGHTVTAIYEVTLVQSGNGLIDPLRYQSDSSHIQDTHQQADELAFLKLRYKKPGESNSHLISRPVKKQEIQSQLSQTSERYRFAAAVVGFAQHLKGSRYGFGSSSTGDDYGSSIELAVNARGRDAFGYRGELISLMRTAQALAQQHAQVEP